MSDALGRAVARRLESECDCQAGLIAPSRGVGLPPAEPSHQESERHGNGWAQNAHTATRWPYNAGQGRRQGSRLRAEAGWNAPRDIGLMPQPTISSDLRGAAISHYRRRGLSDFLTAGRLRPRRILLFTRSRLLSGLPDRQLRAARSMAISHRTSITTACKTRIKRVSSGGAKPRWRA